MYLVIKKMEIKGKKERYVDAGGAEVEDLQTEVGDDVRWSALEDSADEHHREQERRTEHTEQHKALLRVQTTASTSHLHAWHRSIANGRLELPPCTVRVGLRLWLLTI